ncbi:hypothetical protein PRIPAC_90810 [Pristionchus pacificus]|nr:hypothetical protein PRIPAC_90810 [Pristionchus pacificus]
MSTHEESMVIDARGAVQALFSMDCKYCEQGFDGGEHTPCLSTCGHLYCDECIQDNAEHDESIKCVCGGKIDAGDATECFGLKTLFAHLSSCPALRCANCERLHPFDNCVRLRFDHDLERIFCVWCAAMKLNEDSDVIAIRLDDEISEEHLEFSIRSPQDEMMVSLGKEGMELMRTIVCCCLCEKRIKVKKTEQQRRGAFRQRYNLRQEMRDAVVPAVSLPFTILPNSPTGPRVLSNRTSPAQALTCGHFVCSQRCLSEKIDGSDISCGFCDTEIEEDGIKAEFLDEVLETASEGEKCATCLNYRTRKDFCHMDGESRCVWCIVESKTVDANECATGILIEID